MPFRDPYDIPLSTSSAAAAEAYNRSVDASLSFGAGTLPHAEAAVAADEGFAMGQIQLARALQLVGRGREADAARQRACELAAGTTPFEQSHINALSVTIAADGHTALGVIREHLAEYPRDAFMVAQAEGPFGLIAFNGYPDRHEQNLALMESVKDAYSDDDWWFLTSYAFSLNELYRFSESVPLAERSFALRPTGNAAHCVAHVRFETGDIDAGTSFLEGFIPGFERDALIHSHLAWHLALLELASGRPDRVEALYADYLAPESCTAYPLGAHSDATSLTWRRQLLGQQCDDWAEQCSAFASRVFARPGLTFGDVHTAMAYAAAGRFDDLDAFAAAVQARFDAGKIRAGRVVPAIVNAIAAFARGDYNTAIALLEPVQPEVVMVGGSNAQREVFEDTLLEAYLRAGRTEPALALLDKRLARRPSILDTARRARASEAMSEAKTEARA